MPLLMSLPRISIKSPKISLWTSCAAAVTLTPSRLGLVGTVLSSHVGASPPEPALDPPLMPLEPPAPMPAEPLMPPAPPMPPPQSESVAVQPLGQQPSPDVHAVMAVLLQATLQFVALPVN